MSKKLKLPSYGGQALVEGVLMRGKKYASAAFRMPDGSIKNQSEELSGIYKSKIAQIPFLRGLISLWDSLGLGTRYLTISANNQAKEQEKIEGSSLFFSLFISLALGICIFIIGPALLGSWIGRLLNWSPLLTNIIEGILRLVIIILYLFFIGKVPDIRRVFQYHGAEHKTINGFEKGQELSTGQIMQASNYHPRCGTSFLLTFAVISIFVFALFGKLPFLLLVLSRILALPIIAMLAYEYIRFLSNHLDSPIIKFVSYPNMWLQRLTTRQPTDDQVEIAISAFKELLKLENPS
jgi:uncharacterized protein YqhQ